jgi:hypothetical protein
LEQQAKSGRRLADEENAGASLRANWRSWALF